MLNMVKLSANPQNSLTYDKRTSLPRLQRLPVLGEGFERITIRPTYCTERDLKLPHF
jgi:hypothetical protein